MRLGISSYTFGWAVAGGDGASSVSALALIDRAVELNVRILQLCDNLPPDTFADASLERIASCAAERGVAIELGTRGTAPGHLRRFIRAARRLKSPILRLVIDTQEDHPSPDEACRRIAGVLDDLAAAEVVLAIENHDRFPAETLARMIRQLSSRFVGICLDTVNSFGALEGPKVVLETLGPLVVNLHLKDFAVTRFPHMQGFTIEGRPAGAGMLDVAWVLGQLKALGRDPNAIIELWTPPEPTREATVAKEAAWARQSVEAMRKWIQE